MHQFMLYDIITIILIVVSNNSSWIDSYLNVQKFKYFYKEKWQGCVLRIWQRRVPPVHVTINYRYTEKSINGRPCRYQSETAEKWKGDEA